jgi:hypothetical protein
LALTQTQQTLHRMTDLHYAILDRIIAGEKDASIAAALDIHPCTISRLRQSPTFQFEKTRRRMDLEARIADSVEVRVLAQPEDMLELSAREAAQRLIDGLESEDSDQSLDCALEILDRTGRGKVTKQQSTSLSLVGVLSSDEVAAIRSGIEDIRSNFRPITVEATIKPSEKPSEAKPTGEGSSKPADPQANWALRPSKGSTRKVADADAGE